jgi:hypothetical protein
VGSAAHPRRSALNAVGASVKPDSLHIPQRTTPKYQIFAVEPAEDVIDVADYVFDQSYCQAMKLPFATGWHHWSLVRWDPPNTLIHIADFDTYEAAEAFLDALPLSRSAMSNRHYPPLRS